MFTGKNNNHKRNYFNVYVVECFPKPKPAKKYKDKNV